MYQVCVERDFDAAHYLRGYQGKCEALHGHRYRVVVKLSSAGIDDVGMAFDFGVLKRHLDEILARFDHTCLNDVPPFDEINPSSENVARTIYDELQVKLGEAPGSLDCVEVWESPRSWVVYRPD